MHVERRKSITQVVVYAFQSPDGRPLYTAREWTIDDAGRQEVGEILACSPNLEVARGPARAAAMIRLPRFVEDDPAILEVWI